MNRRVEQRFQVYTPVKLTLLDEQEQPELDCLLIDISGAGMKLVADVVLPPDQMISIETGQQVVLAEVRHCSPRGSKFAIGAEKVHVMPAATLEQHASKVARLQALVDDYHLRLKKGIEATPWGPDMLVGMTPEPEHVPEAVPQSLATPEVVVGGPAETTLEQPSPETESSPPQPVLVVCSPVENTLEQPSAETESLPPQPVLAVRSPVENTLEQSSPETEASPPQPVLAVCSPVEPAQDNFDPIRAALETVQEVQPVRSRLTAKVVGAAVGTVLLAALLVAPFKGRLSSFPNNAGAVEKKLKPEAPKNEREPVLQSGATTGTPESAKPQTQPVETAPALAPSAVEPVGSTSQKSAPSAASAPVHPVMTGGALGKAHASLKFTGASWASVCADGQKLFERLLPAGEVREITFSDKAVVRVGNAGAVEIALNGKSLGSLGQSGQLRLLELTSTGLRPLPMGDPADDCAKARAN